VKDLQSQIDRKDNQNTQLQEDVSRLRDKCDKLLKTIDELQSSESSTQLSARRADRELKEEKEKSLRLERELESWKSMRMEKGSSAGTIRRMGTTATWRTGFSEADDAASVIEVPKRKSSISRAPSMTKGFL
jgi:myosin heavy chain 9/10/11/14